MAGLINEPESKRTRLVRWAGAVAASVSLGTAIALHDLSALAIAVAMTAALAWLWMRPRSTAAAVVVVLVLADVLFFTGTAAISNIHHSESVVAIAIPAAVGTARRA